MTGGVNCGGGHRTWQIIIDVTLGCPLPTYIKEEREEAGGLEGARQGGVQLGFPILVGLPFLFQEGERGKERERERERGGRTPSPLSN